MTLTGWWPLHTTSGDAVDLSGNGNHGTLNGSPKRGVAGKAGLQAYSFDGSDDYVSFPSGIISSSTDLTMTLWVRPGSSNSGTTNTTYADIRRNRRFSLRHDRGGDGDESIDMWVDGTYHDNLGSWNVDLWQHIALVYNSSTNKWQIYKNASRINSFTDADSSGSSHNNLGSDDGGNNAEGDICDLRFYERKLTSWEIKQLYNWGNQDLAQPPGSSDSGAAHYWNFNEDSGSTASDSWGSNSGTINGATVGSKGVRDTAFDFNGSSDNVKLSSKTGITDPITVSAWVKRQGTGGTNPRVVSERGNFELLEDNGYINGDNSMAFRLWDSSDTPHNYDEPDPIPTGAWAHYAAVADGSKIILYRNGEPATSSSYSFTHTDNASSGAAIGDRADVSSASDEFNGLIDDVRIYSRALKPWEVHQLYRWGTRGRDMRKITVNKRG